jgi:hypothetical protein
MTIRNNVVKTQRKIYKDMSEGTNAYIQEVQTKAAQAIIKGFGDNAECRTYMQLFAETSEQLDRLMGADGTTGPGNEGRDRARAYLMAAGTCGPETVHNFENAVTSDLD